MLTPEAGIPYVQRELAAGGQGEVVVARHLEVILNEFDKSNYRSFCMVYPTRDDVIDTLADPDSDPVVGLGLAIAGRGGWQSPPAGLTVSAP